MRKFWLIVSSIIMAANIMAQSANEALLADEITWYGIDYSRVKLIGEFSQFGEAGVKSESEIRDKYFPAWNELVLKEASKYNIKSAFRKDNVIYDLDVVNLRNSKVNPGHLISLSDNDQNHLNEDAIQAVVSEYPASGKGYGLVFIAESLDKRRETGSYYVVLFDRATGKVVLNKRFEGKAAGFGIRNYWARSYYEVLEQSKASYKKWLKESTVKN